MKTRKRGGHKVFFHHVKTGKIDSPLKARKKVKPDDCAANALFALGIMNESTANHMADKYTVDAGLSYIAMATLLDTAYPGTTHLWRRVAIDYSNLDRYLEVGEGTIAATSGNSMNHYFVIIRQATGYYVVDTYFKIICTLDQYFEWYTPYWNKHRDVFAIIDSNNPVTEPRPVITPAILREALWDDRRNTWSAAKLDSTGLWYVTTTDPLPRLERGPAAMTVDARAPSIPLQPMTPGSFAEYAASRGDSSNVQPVSFPRPAEMIDALAPRRQAAEMPRAPAAMAVDPEPVVRPGMFGPSYRGTGFDGHVSRLPFQGPDALAQSPFPLESLPTEICHVVINSKGELVFINTGGGEIEIANTDMPAESKRLIREIKKGKLRGHFNVHMLRNHPDGKLRGVPISISQVESDEEL